VIDRWFFLWLVAFFAGWGLLTSIIIWAELSAHWVALAGIGTGWLLDDISEAIADRSRRAAR